MKAKAMSCGASMLVIMLLLFPTGAYAQFGDIFSAILSTITGPIGTDQELKTAFAGSSMDQ